jgi:SPP1 family predicted phage head-tail adaptor
MANSGAGTFNRRVEIQSPVEATQDTFGEYPPTWTAIATRWASLKALSSRELFIAQQVVAQASHLCKIRWYRNISPKYRLVFGTRVFNIAGNADPGESRVETWLYLTEQMDAQLPSLDFTLPASSMYLGIL